jgi:hypothetical protein
MELDAGLLTEPDEDVRGALVAANGGSGGVVD